MEAAIVPALISGTLKVVGNKLASLLIKEYSSIVGVTKHLQELQDQVEEINCWLEAAGENATWNDPSLKWLKKLKVIAYDLDDVVGEFQQNAEKHDADGDSVIVSKCLYTKPKSLIFKCKVARKIKEIKNRFAAIVKQRSDFSAIVNSLPVGPSVRHVNNTPVGMPSLPIVDEASVLGRDQEKHTIISKLVEINDKQKIKIVSVIGLGGSGKTTLAKLVFNDHNIEKHFEIRLWVHVSQEFVVAKLIEKLFEAISGEKYEGYSLQQMSTKILEKLTKKRFLVVLDDVWTNSRILLEEFMVCLKCGLPGSGVLVTTRSSKVAETVGSTYQFDLPLLSPNDSWNLFQQSLVMPAKGLGFEFVEVGKEIVNKCGRLPLAVKVLAGAMRGKERIEEWHAMRDSNLLAAKGDEAGVSVSSCLMLSYFHLPSHLKQCFTICSLFPKGHFIDKEKLIDLWISHNMITLETGVDCLEYIGHKCFNSLVQMSFLQDVHEADGRMICKMHDLVHDLGLSILGDEISLVVPKKEETKSYRYFSLTDHPENPVPENILEKARGVYLTRYNDYTYDMALKHAKHLRSITVESRYAAGVPNAAFQMPNLKCLALTRLNCEALPEAISDVWSLEALHVTQSLYLLELPESIGKLKKLRTLNLSSCAYLTSLPDSLGDCHMMSSLDLRRCTDLIELPDSIGRNEKLRVLRLGYTNLVRLPSGITSLRNLECLDLRWCSKLEMLPEGIENLKKLEVLNLDGCIALRAMPVGIGQLTRLQTLSLFIVDEGVESARISELGPLARVGEELRISISGLMDPDDVHKACLKQKTNLQSLNLEWRSRYHTDEVTTEIEEAVLDGLEPPPVIKGLEIDGYAGRRHARWMLKQAGARVQGVVPQFLCLTSMRLKDFPNLKHLGGLVELPCLEYLLLSCMPALESISGGPFPSLVELIMESLPRLGEVWMVTEMNFAGGEEGKLQIGTCLLKLTIQGCPKLMLKPYLPSSLEQLLLSRSNAELVQSWGQDGQGSSSSIGDAGFSPSFSCSHLKTLDILEMTTSSSTGPRSRCGWDLLQHFTTLERLHVNCGGLTEMPESMRSLKSLQVLDIVHCSAIRMLPEWLGELRSLQEMAIYGCDSLSSLPQSMGDLTSLRKLEISGCGALHQLPESLGELCSLREFEIINLKGLTWLPQSMCCLTSLRKLKISGCGALHQLPESLGELCSFCEFFEINNFKGLACLPQSMCRLTSLEDLEIGDCPGIKSLPEWIQGLTTLQRLMIYDCPDLKRRYERGKGEDWHLISHIPRFFFGLIG